MDIRLQTNTIWRDIFCDVQKREYLTEEQISSGDFRDEDILEEILDEFYTNNDFWSPRSKDKFHFSPLPNMESCHICHGPDSKLRGILAMDIQAENIQKEQVIQSAIIGFKNLMRLKSASYAGAYIDAIRELSFIKNFQIFDNGEMVKAGYRELWVPNPDYENIVLDTVVFNAKQPSLTNQISGDNLATSKYPCPIYV